MSQHIALVADSKTISKQLNLEDQVSGTREGAGGGQAEATERERKEIKIVAL